jgi:uncharacterized protein
MPYGFWWAIMVSSREKAGQEAKMKAIVAALCVLLAPTAGLVPARAAELGDAGAVMVRTGRPVAASSLQIQAGRGSPRAQAVLCYMYSRGEGVPQDFRVAAYWCRRAADQGNADGQYLLGLMYNKGQGVPENFTEAYMWLNLAAARVTGNRRDLFYRVRDSVATKMTPDQIAFAQQCTTEFAPIYER